MFSFGKVVSSFADDQRYSARVDFDACRGSPLASKKAQGRLVSSYLNKDGIVSGVLCAVFNRR